MNNLIKELTQFYTCLNHQQVIDLIESKIDLERYDVLEDKYYRVWIPKTLDKPIPMLVAHSDTVFQKIPVKIETDKGKIWCKDRGRGLGADDRNGCWLLSHMMQQRPDDFIFALFDLEESGCVGSLSFDIVPIKEKISVIIGLDRQGKSDLALYGFESEELITLLESIQGYNVCYGTMSDCAVLAELSDLCCFNISVGYHRQHTSKEYTIISHLKKARRLLLDLPEQFWNKQFNCELLLSNNDSYDLPFDYNWPWPSQKEQKRRW